MQNILLMQLALAAPLSILFGIFGCISSWSKTSFFSHMFSHSLLLPVAIGLLINITHDWQMMAMCVIFAILYGFLTSYCSAKSKYHQEDAILLIVSFFCLALALMLTTLSGRSSEVMMYISGDMIFVDKADIAIITIMLICVVAFVKLTWHQFLLFSINQDICATKYRHCQAMNNTYIILQGVFVAFAVKISGVMLISATLIMPALIARRISNSPFQMIVVSCVTSFCTMFFGIIVAFQGNLHTQSVIVIIYCLIMSALFAGTLARSFFQSNVVKN